MKSWISHYRGRPYREDAGGPEAYDCKGLVRAVQQAIWGRDVPPLLHPGGAVPARRDFGRWERVQTPAQAGDILEVRGTDGPHVGVFVLAGARLAVLHAHRGLGVRLNRLDELLAPGGGFGRPQVWRYAP